MNMFRLIWRDGEGRDSRVYEVLGDKHAVFALWLTLLKSNIHPLSVEIFDINGNKQHPEKGLQEGLILSNPWVHDPAVF